MHGNVLEWKRTGGGNTLRWDCPGMGLSWDGMILGCMVMSWDENVRGWDCPGMGMSWDGNVLRIN